MLDPWQLWYHKRNFAQPLESSMCTHQNHTDMFIPWYHTGPAQASQWCIRGGSWGLIKLLPLNFPSITDIQLYSYIYNIYILFPDSHGTPCTSTKTSKKRAAKVVSCLAGIIQQHLHGPFMWWCKSSIFNVFQWL